MSKKRRAKDLATKKDRAMCCLQVAAAEVKGAHNDINSEVYDQKGRGMCEVILAGLDRYREHLNSLTISQ